MLREGKGTRREGNTRERRDKTKSMFEKRTREIMMYHKIHERHDTLTFDSLAREKKRNMRHSE